MKKGQIYEGYVERLDFPNKGIVKCEDETAVVKNTIPGQKISFMVTKKRKGKAKMNMLPQAFAKTNKRNVPYFGVIFVSVFIFYVFIC